MDLQLTSNFSLTADQTATFNPLFCLILIPLFDNFVYPFLSKMRITYKPLRRMKVGMFLTSISFFAAGLLQIYVSRHPKEISFAIQVIRYQSINLSLQSIQYLILTTGEVLVSISGLEFSYSQAPKSMKSVMMAMWLMTVASKI